MPDETPRYPGGSGGVMSAVPTKAKTLNEKIGHALELTMQIQDILKIALPKPPTEPNGPSKFGEAHTGVEQIIANLLDIRDEVNKL